MTVWTSLPPLPLESSGTWQVESLDSYVARLSTTLNMSELQLLNEVDGLGIVGTGSITKRRNSLVGPSERSSRRRQALEQMTGVDLRGSTLCVLREIIHPSGGFSPTRRWCPACLKEGDRKVTNRLIWSMQDYTICFRHKQEIVNECSKCGSKQEFGESSKKRGYCSKCGFDLAECFEPLTEFLGSGWVSRNL